MGKKQVRTPKSELLAEAPSVRKGEVFRATNRGLERLQVNELRNGGKYNRKDELPYHRIASVSLEEKVSKRGSWILSSLGVILLLAGIGVPSLSIIPTFPVHVVASRLSILMNAFAFQNLTSSAVGFLLLASRFPRKTTDEWWQIRGYGLGQDEYNGWQISSKSKDSAKLVDAVRDGIAKTDKYIGDD